jgi:hypothetical protein
VGWCGLLLFLTQRRHKPLFLRRSHRWRKRTTWVLRRAKNALLRMTTSCVRAAEGLGLALVGLVPVKAPVAAVAASGEAFEFLRSPSRDCSRDASGRRISCEGYELAAARLTGNPSLVHYTWRSTRNYRALPGGQPRTAVPT